MPVSLWTQIIT